jgi:pyrroline-5-carboxylate reductase
MGGAILMGWARTRAVAASDLMIADLHPSEAAHEAERAGAKLNPSDAELRDAQTVILAVKPQAWADAARQYTTVLGPEAVVISIVAGVDTGAIVRAFGGRVTARAMPNTAVAINQGTISLYADDPAALAHAHALFDPLGTVIELTDESQIHAATAVGGSGPAYLYAFVEALDAAGAAAGLSPQDARRLARATITGAAALLAETGEEPAELRRQVTSPGGTTEAALDVLLGEHGLPLLLRDAVTKAAGRSRELGA